MKTPLPRRLFFWTLTASYVLVTTVVLMYVFGYQRDFTAKIFVHTGSVSLKTNPTDVTIFINGHKPRSRFVNVINNSYHVRNLRARTHAVTVVADDFKPWAKEALVHSGVATEFWNVVLVREFYERTSYALDNADDFFPAPKEQLFAATRQVNHLQAVRIFDVNRNTATHTFLFNNTHFTGNPYDNIEWDPDNRAVIIPLEKITDDARDYAVAYLNSNTTYMLSDFLPSATLRAVRWNPKDKNGIYYITDDTLYRADLAPVARGTAVTPIRVADNVVAYDFTDDGIYLLTTDNALLRDSDVYGKNAKAIATLDLPATMREARLDAYDNDRMIVINDTDHELHLYNRGARNIYKRKLADNIVGAHFSDDGKKLLYYSPFEIFVYYTRDWDAQPQPKEDTVQPIIRYSQTLSNVHFAKDYAHVMYTVGGDLKITELDNRGGATTETIVTIAADNTKVLNRHRQNRVYFLDNTDNARRQLQSITFPERPFLQF